MTPAQREVLAYMIEQRKYLFKNMKWVTETWDKETNYTYAVNISLQPTPKASS
jgi:hypothetical protein